MSLYLGRSLSRIAHTLQSALSLFPIVLSSTAFLAWLQLIYLRDI